MGAINISTYWLIVTLLQPNLDLCYCCDFFAGIKTQLMAEIPSMTSNFAILLGYNTQGRKLF
jgi:hypothetical protein